LPKVTVYDRKGGSLQTHRRQADWDRKKELFTRWQRRMRKVSTKCKRTTEEGRKEWVDNRERKLKIIVFI
jgi:hypothetical protein